ncbi:MAG TPA: metallophosphoesterase [Flavobacterium sp.]|jgi:Icc protein|nr:metallophosphoesterase [Flavobacterium sp.]HPJ09916.1 metallophosphoesterase [Flavobacterium sp.]
MSQNRKTIFYFTDTHLHEDGPGEHGADAHKNWNEILTELKLRNPDQVIFGGDIGLFSAYPEFFEALKDYPNLHVTPGNHDTSAHVRLFFSTAENHSAAGFFSAMEDEHLKWFFLDSSTDKIGTEQLDWFRQELAATLKPVILFLHHPILSVASAVDRKYPLENRVELQELLLRHQQPVTIFCGHYHIEDETSQENIRQFVTPAVSYQIKKNTVDIEGDASYFGYRMIYVDGSSIETEVITLYPDDF